jgi:sensor histidine kinase YesM
MLRPTSPRGNPVGTRSPHSSWGKRARDYNLGVHDPASTNKISGSTRALFALWGLFWLLMISVAIQENLSDRGVRWWEPLLWEGSSCLVATCWLLLQRRVARDWDTYLTQPLRWFGKHLVWLPVIIVTFIVSIYAIRHGVYALTDEIYDHNPWPTVFVYESIKIVLFSVLWMSIIFGLESFGGWQKERERLLELQKHLAESQLAQLKAQLQPHFLFNALNTISALMQTDVDRADRLLTKLADLLRASLKSSARQSTPLRDELELLRLYAEIMDERFAGRVTLAWHIADDAQDAAVPSLLLQPLLENAFKHGVERSSLPVAIRIEARREGERLLVAIHNTGSTLAAQPGLGIGLRNCRDRLGVLYGGQAILDLVTDTDGVTARLALPFERSAA